MKTSEKQRLHCQMIADLIGFINIKGWSCTFGDAYRAPSVPYGHPRSMHRQRLAVDLNLFDPEGNYRKDSEAYRFAGEYWEGLHPKNTWGGINDGNHFSSFAEDYGMEF